MSGARDHGGGIDAAAARYGGTRAAWLDLSTGINPVPYIMGDLPPDCWTALPDRAAQDRLVAAARRFWGIPDAAEVVAAPGASALIARLPALTGVLRVSIPRATYNEHAAAFRAAGAEVTEGLAETVIRVHPNNPDGRLAEAGALDAPLLILDESFCDTMPGDSHVARCARPGTIVLKSFGKFWGLAGLRLGFAIGHPETLSPAGAPSLSDLLGPWAVSGPALAVGAQALEDEGWAGATRKRLAGDADRLDALLTAKGARVAGGTTLFRLYEVEDAAAWQDRLAEGRVWSRVFPYADRWLRLGQPAPDRWDQLEAAL